MLRALTITREQLDEVVETNTKRRFAFDETGTRIRASRGHVLGTSCVNLAEVEAGLRQHERRRAAALLDRLRFLPTDREAAHRAQMEGIATEDHAAVTCRKCRHLLYELRKGKRER